jgi:hypothetical protein
MSSPGAKVTGNGGNTYARKCRSRTVFGVDRRRCEPPYVQDGLPFRLIDSIPRGSYPFVLYFRDTMTTRDYDDDVDASTS